MPSISTKVNSIKNEMSITQGTPKAIRSFYCVTYSKVHVDESSKIIMYSTIYDTYHCLVCIFFLYALIPVVIAFAY